MLEQLYGYVTRPQRTAVLAVDDADVRQRMLAQLQGEQVEVTLADSSEQLVEALGKAPRVDAVLLEEGFGGLDRRDLRAALTVQPGFGPLPLVLYRPGGDGSTWLSDDAIAVQVARNEPELFDTALKALHRNIARLPEAKRAVIDSVHGSDKPLAGKKVLIVDDDMRNIFALATVLEEHGMDIVWADNGREAINRVVNDSAIQVVLMDVMMPEMDGLVTMKEIRKLNQGRNLPMIAVTAKAMKGDREKCIEAGAWDYLAKPVHTPDLLTVLRAWLQ
jgi:CheY-like chemotaxis protein